MPWDGRERRKTPISIGGENRRRKQVEPIHPWRWRMLAAWIVIFSVMSILAYRQSAKVESLQRTNCNLKNFLVRAANARIKEANKANNAEEKRINKQAYQGYIAIIDAIDNDSTGDCKRIVLLHLKQ